jgi:tryptophan-rich sensory protein
MPSESLTSWPPRPGRDGSGLAISIAIAVALASAVSAVLILVLPGDDGGLDDQLAANGPISALIASAVAFVWPCLFAGLGFSYWLVARTAQRSNSALVGLLLLVAVCILYPLATYAITAPELIILGNSATIVLVTIVAWQCHEVSPLSGLFPALTGLWVTFATLALIALSLQTPF